ncbi:MAG: PstS family phosphate ABC transporter substrate-binding protein [bacterium]
MKIGGVKLWPMLAVLWLGGSRPEGDSPTSGSLVIMSAESLAPVAEKQIEEFQRLYEKTSITMKLASSRETVLQFLRGDVQTIFLDRQLSADEKQIARENAISIDSFRIAIEGVAVIVHPQNPVQNLSIAQVGAIYRGEIQNWHAVGGNSRPILPIALSRNTGTAEFMLARAVHDTSFSLSTYICASSRKLLEAIAQRDNSIGFVSSAWLSDSTSSIAAIADKIKVLKLAKDTTANCVALYQAAVYRGDYPLCRPLYLLSRDRRLGVAVGFIAFVTSAAGQKVILNAGLVPATMPVKLVKFRS